MVAAAQITAMDGGITVATGSGLQVLAGPREAHCKALVVSGFFDHAHLLSLTVERPKMS